MTREDLISVRLVYKRLLQQEEYLAGLRSLIQSSERPGRGGSRTRSASSKFERLVVKIIETENLIQDLRGQMELARVELATKLMNEVEDIQTRLTLYYYYVRTMTWSEVARAVRLPRSRAHDLAKSYLGGLDRTAQI